MIKVDHLKYKYPLTDKLALDDISFEVDKGDFVGVIGENSSGKSTLCQALIGLVPHFYKGAYGGSVMIGDICVKDSEVSEIAKKAGMVFQNPFTQVTGSKLTVYDEIAFGLENMGIDRNEMKIRIDESLRLLNIYEFKDKNPFDLSGGQMQRMAIAGIIAMKPEVIILDEPTSQLDPQGSAEVFESIYELSRQGMTVIIAEHKMEKIAQYCNKLLVLKGGRQMDFDSPANVFLRDDLDEIGICAPVYTSVCRRLGLKIQSRYPVTLEEAVSVLR